MHIESESLLAAERVRANWIVGEIAGLLQCPMEEETLVELPEIPVHRAAYRGWQLHVYLELEEVETDAPLGFWVLILSCGEERASRVFEGPCYHQAVQHVRRFAEDLAYRRRWLYSSFGAEGRSANANGPERPGASTEADTGSILDG
jgi:hypothetical protein